MYEGKRDQEVTWYPGRTPAIAMAGIGSRELVMRVVVQVERGRVHGYEGMLQTPKILGFPATREGPQIGTRVPGGYRDAAELTRVTPSTSRL